MPEALGPSEDASEALPNAPKGPPEARPSTSCAEHFLDPVYELVREFSAGLRETNDPNLEFAFSREFNLRWTAQKRAEERYCLEFLARLDEQERTAEPGAELSALYLARSTVRLELTHILRVERRAEVEVLLAQSLADARASRVRVAVFSVQMELGHHYREYGRLAEAEDHYKAALVFADNSSALCQTARVFYWLGITLAARGDSLPQAVFAFDCASRFGALEFASLIEKQKCRLQLGERDALIAETQPGPDAGIREIAAAVAAAIALGRRRKRVLQLVRQGIEVAMRKGDACWQSTFQWYGDRT